jgi:hypothetical protein
MIDHVNRARTWTVRLSWAKALPQQQVYSSTITDVVRLLGGPASWDMKLDTVQRVLSGEIPLPRPQDLILDSLKSSAAKKFVFSMVVSSMVVSSMMII